jgi:hypothetical protein
MEGLDSMAEALNSMTDQHVMRERPTAQSFRGRPTTLPGPAGAPTPKVFAKVNHAEEAATRRVIEGQIMALTIMAAEKDANTPQAKKLKETLPRLLRQYRHTGDTTPVLKAVGKIMFTAWEPRNPEIREHLAKLRAVL